MPEPRDYVSAIKPTWCAGCGNFGMFEALKRALAARNLNKEEFAIVWGVGCHGNGADFYDVSGFHGLHGRALPVAGGLALTRPDLKVITEMGDGDGYGIGLGHFVHACRRNQNLTVITHNNQIYGLTTGQASPTTDHSMRTVSTPAGVLEKPVNPLGLALAEGATFVARGFAGDIPHLSSLYEAALAHRGFALVDVFQPCVTWNHVNTFAWMRERGYRLEDEGWATNDLTAAFELSRTTFHSLTCTPDECRVPLGIYYQEEGVLPYEDGVPGAAVAGWRNALEPRNVTDIIKSLT